VDYFTSQTIKPDFLPQLFKTGQITPKRFWTAVCYSNDGFVFFLFIFAKSLKNHSKSQKNHKIENPILLNST
jgi:hypothetical protein